MASDLQEIFDRIGQCRKYTNELEGEISAWATEAIEYRRVPYPHALAVTPTKYAVKATQKSLPPIGIRMKTGMIANEIRACLDGLACVLAIRNSGSAGKTSFPVCETEEAFKKEGKKKIKLLSQGDQRKIEDVQFYKNKNPYIMNLHKLDIHRKHIRLNESAAVTGISFGRNESIIFGAATYCKISGAEIDGVNSGEIELPASSFPGLNQDINVALNIPVDIVSRALPGVTFSEPEAVKGWEVLATLRDCANAVEEVVRLFS